MDAAPVKPEALVSTVVLRIVGGVEKEGAVLRAHARDPRVEGSVDTWEVLYPDDSRETLHWAALRTALRPELQRDYHGVSRQNKQSKKWRAQVSSPKRGSELRVSTTVASSACQLQAALAYDKAVRALRQQYPDEARLKRVNFPAAGEEQATTRTRLGAATHAAGKTKAVHQRKEDEPLSSVKKTRFAAPEDDAAPHEALDGAPTAPPGFALAAASPEASMTPAIATTPGFDSDAADAVPMHVEQAEAPASAAATAGAAASGAAVPSAAAPPVAMNAAALPAAIAAARAEARASQSAARAAQSAARAAAAKERAAQEKVAALERCEAAVAAKAATAAAKAAKTAEAEAVRAAFNAEDDARQALLEKAASIQANLAQTRREAEEVRVSMIATYARVQAVQRAETDAAAADSAAADAVADALRAVGGPAVLPQ
jgi:hypothetical protein